MKRLVILGARGGFGQAITRALGEEGRPVLTASRGPGCDLEIDVEEPESLLQGLRPGDVLVDAAGPFQGRSTGLLEAALEREAHVIDINDSLVHARKTLELEERIHQSHSIVLPSCSTVSVLSAALLDRCLDEGFHTRRLESFLVPASRHTARAGTARSLIRSVGAPVGSFHDGELVERTGWSDPVHWSLPAPVGEITARRFESADVLWLPRCFADLEHVEMLVDTNVPGLNSLLALAARLPPLRRLFELGAPVGAALTRSLGRSASALAYRLENEKGERRGLALVASSGGQRAAVLPVVLAVRALEQGRFEGGQLVPCHRQVEAGELFEGLEQIGLPLREIDPGSP